jgi:Domain of unknown function (DUF4105)
MKSLVRIFLIFLSTTGVFGQQLSDQATISVVTFGPFQGELFSAFGHSAFRIYDPVQRIDDAYHYGVFDFDQPNFYLNFAKGYLYYSLGTNDYQPFRNYYIHYNRKVHEQVLNLTERQKQKLYDYLQWNALPENVHYRYDYFYNNCATKIRDVVIDALGDDVNFDGSYITTDYTIRELTDIYLRYQPWGDLGIDIGLGLPIDKKAAPSEYMFLPDYVESGFDHASIRQEGSAVPLVREKILVYDPVEEVLPKGLPHPLFVFSIVALICLAISILDYKRKKLSVWLDVILFSSTGVIGALLLFLWLFTDHNDSAYNFNLLWAVPTNLIVVVAFIKTPSWLKKYFFVIAILQGLLLVTWWALPQTLNTALIPVAASLLIRSSLNYVLRQPAI